MAGSHIQGDDLKRACTAPDYMVACRSHYRIKITITRFNPLMDVAYLDIGRLGALRGLCTQMPASQS